MANSELEAETIRQEGGEAMFIHQNSLVDPALFYVDPLQTKKYDAVYNAQFLSFKRHELCKDLNNISLLSYNMDKDYYLNNVKPLNNYTLINSIDEDACKLGWVGYSGVNKIYNESYSGLCLSAVEGGMHASIEYLLAGLPIITTSSIGARDYFFNEKNSTFVDDEPATIANAVKNNIANYSLERCISIRESAVAQQKSEILKIQDLISSLINRHGKNIDIDHLWPIIYRDKLIQMESVDKFVSDELGRLSKISE